jgi:hypothetical protein
VTLSPDDGERYRCGECEVQRVPNVASAGVADSAGNTLKHAEASDVKSPVHFHTHPVSTKMMSSACQKLLF